MRASIQRIENSERGSYPQLGYRGSYIASYRARFCSGQGLRPRQHWGLRLVPSPTTRPPRISLCEWGSGSRTRACAGSRCWRGRNEFGSEEQEGRQSLGDGWKTGRDFQSGEGERESVCSWDLDRQTLDVRASGESFWGRFE
jgi:hypothetical protein